MVYNSWGGWLSPYLVITVSGYREQRESYVRTLFIFTTCVKMLSEIWIDYVTRIVKRTNAVTCAHPRKRVVWHDVKACVRYR
jgi:hypothetical protein